MTVTTHSCGVVVYDLTTPAGQRVLLNTVSEPGGPWTPQPDGRVVEPANDGGWGHAPHQCPPTPPQPALFDTEPEEDEQGQIPTAEGRRILAAVDAHPRQDLIRQLAEITSDIDGEAGGGGGMWWHLSQATAVVDAIPGLQLEDGAL